MRNLLPLRKALADSIERAKPATFRRFRASRKEPLQANADSQERNSRASAFGNCLLQPAAVEELRRSKMPNTRQNNLLSATYNFRVLGGDCIRTDGRQRLHHRCKISGLVIDDRDHSNPLVDGSILPSCLSREQATRTARANALNRASTLWWFERPYIVFKCTLARAPRAKPSKKSSTNSDCKSPTSRVFTFVSTTCAARPLRSIAARPSVSSMVMRKYPARRMPRLSPSARSNASPSAIPTSSTVWCWSTSRSPLQVRSRSNAPWRVNNSSMWSKKRIPVETLYRPAPSIVSFRCISVSAVLRSIAAVRFFTSRLPSSQFPLASVPSREFPPPYVRASQW